MKLSSYFGMAFCVMALSFTFTSCADDDEDYTYHSGGGHTSSNISAPTLDRYLSTTDYDGFSIRVRFRNGGDRPSNMSCIAHWAAFPKRPGSKPSKDELRQRDRMRVYDSNDYKTTFDVSHAGYNGGTYIYYYLECSNSQYTTETDVTYEIVKR